MIPVVAALLPMLGKLGERFINSKFPDPVEREQAQKEWDAQVAQIEQSDIDSFRDFVVAYEGAGADVSPTLQFLRGSVRPVLTYFLAGAYIWCFMRPVEFTPETLQQLWQLNLLSMGFWYGERALRNLGLDLSKKDK